MAQVDCANIDELRQQPARITAQRADIDLCYLSLVRVQRILDDQIASHPCHFAAALDHSNQFVVGLDVAAAFSGECSRRQQYGDQEKPTCLKESKCARRRCREPSTDPQAPHSFSSLTRARPRKACSICALKNALQFLQDKKRLQPLECFMEKIRETPMPR